MEEKTLSNDDGLGARASSPASSSSSIPISDPNEKKAAEDGRAPINATNGRRPTKGWHQRGYLPHFDGGPLIQAITYWLADALPKEVLARLDAELPDIPANHDKRRSRIEGFLDAGYGDCWLRRPEVARIVLDAWGFFDGKRYDLLEWVIMPNHVHLLVRTSNSFSLSDLVHGWKSYTARQINDAIGRQGHVWQADYWDRYVRDETHLSAVTRYIHENPVKARLVARAEDWQWSSVLGARASSPPCFSMPLIRRNAAEDGRAPNANSFPA